MLDEKEQIVYYCTYCSSYAVWFPVLRLLDVTDRKMHTKLWDQIPAAD